MKYIVITGASSGIGHSTAKAFAARGKNLILIARRKELLEKLKQEILRNYPKLDIIIKIVDISINTNVYNTYDELKKYSIETWINNAGFGNYDLVQKQNLKKINQMICLNVEALTIFSTLYVQDYHNVEGTQIINISSAGGYTIVPTAITYCATKFYVSAFTEGLARELKENGCMLKAKVLAPAATKTEFGKKANNVSDYDYNKSFGIYHTSEEMAKYLLSLYDSDMTVGCIDRESFKFTLTNCLLPYAGESKHNQKNKG